MEELVRQLLGDSDERRSKAEDLLEEVLVRSRRGAEIISAFVRAEIRKELEARAARSREELADLFERMAGLVGEHLAAGRWPDWARGWREAGGDGAAAEPAEGSPASDGHAAKAVGKKAGAKKAGAKKAGAKKAGAKKVGAAGAPAKKAAKKAAKRAGGAGVAAKKAPSASSATRSAAKKAAKKASG